MISHGEEIVFNAIADMPSLLLANSESREVALKRYQLKKINVEGKQIPIYVYLDASQDKVEFWHAHPCMDWMEWTVRQEF